MDPHSLFVFAALALLAIATPGPTVLLALYNGARLGVRAALPGVAGAVLSDFVLMGAVALAGSLALARRAGGRRSWPRAAPEAGHGTSAGRGRGNTGRIHRVI